ncbi:MAG TPA: hypothetical protein VF173_35590 [Thermoanaerobaculia bacterium]|nr:hypothetical protein [Thermoanaerobaculia bacterium]
MTTGSAAARRPGLVMAIGGAEDKVRERIVLRRFVAEAGDPDVSLVVLATASEVPEAGSATRTSSTTWTPGASRCCASARGRMRWTPVRRCSTC